MSVLPKSSYRFNIISIKIPGSFLEKNWHFCLFVFKIYLFIYFWLCWVFVSVRGLSLLAASGGHSSSQCVGLSLSRPLLLWSTGSRRAGSVVVAHGPNCSVACGIFPDQGSNPCPLHWQADSQPLRHQGSPDMLILRYIWKNEGPSITKVTLKKTKVGWLTLLDFNTYFKARQIMPCGIDRRRDLEMHATEWKVQKYTHIYIVSWFPTKLPR